MSALEAEKAGSMNADTLVKSACVPVLVLALTACGGGGSSIETPGARYGVGGLVTGLVGTVVLRNNGGDDLSRSTNGSFSFDTPLIGGSAYSVTVRTQPAGQICTVSNGSGIIGTAHVIDVEVVCVTDPPPPEFTVSGTVSGLAGTVVLGNGGDVLTLTENGGFAFDTPLPDGGTYIVSVLTQPEGQTCTVSNGAGNVSAANVTNVSVTCVTDPVVLPEGDLIACFNPDLFQTGSTYTASYRVRRYAPESLGFYDLSFGITETRTVLGAASFNGEDNAVRIQVSSLAEDIGIAPGGVVPITDELDGFTGDFMAYYAVDFPAGKVRYLGAERDLGDGHEPYELADPHELLDFDPDPDEFVEQSFTLETNGAPRVKEVLWTYEGQGAIEVPAGSIDACKVSGTGHEPSLFVSTTAGSPFEIFFAIGTGIPVYIEYVQDNLGEFPDAVMNMQLIEASIDGEPVH